MVDKFVLLTSAQYEKGGYQNRFRHKDKWITKPVKSGISNIYEKQYADGQSLETLNIKWISVIRDTLGIRTPLIKDNCRNESGTDKIISIVKAERGTTYITNPSAKDKYLDEDKICRSGINIEYCKVPKHLHKSTFEILEEYGIEGAIKQLWKA